MRERLQHLGAWLLFCIGAGIFLREWQVYAASHQMFEGYDTALRYLSRTYTAAGFIPYRDFGLIYPPGVFLPAYLFPLLQPEQQNLIIFTFFLFLLLLGVYLFSQFRASFGKLVISSSIFLLLSALLLQEENIADLLLGLLMVIVPLALIRKTNLGYQWALFLLPALVLQWRWDRLLVFLLIEGSMAIGARHQRVFREIVARQLLGTLAGCFGLVIYLAWHDTLRAGWQFFFWLPTQVLWEYRDLPLPSLIGFPGIFFTIPLMVYALFALSLITMGLFPEKSQKSSPLVVLYLLLLPLTGIPYALGRSDAGHFFPFLFFTGMSILMALLLFRQRQSHIFIPLLFILVGLPLRLLPTLTYIHAPLPAISHQLAGQLQDCRAHTNRQFYQSLFVGRTRYNRYYANNVALYFINPTIKPATRYIAEDPGLQNSCEYGAQIQQDLQTAPKPLLAFITNEQQRRTEANKTQTMVSCGHIETYLNTAPYQILGTCVSYGIPYEIRLY